MPYIIPIESSHSCQDLGQTLLLSSMWHQKNQQDVWRTMNTPRRQDLLKELRMRKPDKETMHIQLHGTDLAHLPFAGKLKWLIEFPTHGVGFWHGLQAWFQAMSLIQASGLCLPACQVLQQQHQQVCQALVTRHNHLQGLLRVSCQHLSVVTSQGYWDSLQRTWNIMPNENPRRMMAQPAWKTQMQRQPLQHLTTVMEHQPSQDDAASSSPAADGWSPPDGYQSSATQRDADAPTRNFEQKFVSP